MSEKKVNVKITASISEFEKTIKKAQKEVKELTDVLDDINKNKFGENLEKQFKDISDAAEKMQEQLEDMKDTLDDIEKIKLDKVEKEFEDIAEATEDLNDKLEDTVDKLEKLNKTKADKLKDDLEDTSEAAEDLNETLEDTKESIEDLAKAKLDKLEQQYKDVLDTADKLNETIEDNQEALSELDRADVDKLRNSLENIAESSEDIGDRLGDLRKQLDNLDSEGLDKFNNDLKEAGSAVESLGDKVRDAADDVDRHLNEAFENTDERVEKVSDHIEDMGDKLSKVDGLENIGDDFNKLFDNKNVKVNLEGDKSGFFDNLADGFISGSIAGDKLSDAVQDIVDGVDRLADSMKDMNQFTFEEQIKNYDEFINDMVKAQDEYNDALEKSNKLTEEIADKRKKIDEADNKYTEEVDKAYDELEALEKKEEAINNLNEAIELYNKEAIEWANKNDAVTKALEEQRKIVNNLEKEYSNLSEEVKSFDDVVADAVNRARDIGKSFDDLSFNSNIIKDLKDELKNMNYDNVDDGINKLSHAYEGIKEANDKMLAGIKRCNDEFKKLGAFDDATDEIKNLIRQFNDLYDAIDNGNEVDTKEFMNVLDALDKATTIDNASESFNELAESIKKWIQTTKQGIELSDKLSHALDEYDSIGKSLSAAQDAMKKTANAFDDLNKKEIKFDMNESINELERIKESVRDIKTIFDKMSFDSKLTKELRESLGNIDFLNYTELENKLHDLDKLFANTLSELTRRLENNFKNLNNIDVSGFSEGIQDLVKNCKDVSDVIDLLKKLGDDPESVLWSQYGEGDLFGGALEELKWDLEEIVFQSRELKEAISFEEGTEGLEKFCKNMEQGIEIIDNLVDAYTEFYNVFGDNIYSRLNHGSSENYEGFNLEDEKLKLERLERAKEVLEEKRREFEESAQEIEDYKKANDLAGKSEEDLQKELEETYKKLQQKSKELKEAEEAQRKHRQEVIKQQKEANELQNDLDALNETLAKGNKIAEDAAKGFNEEYKAYEKLSKKVKEYLEDEEKSIVLREKVAKSFKQVSDAMESVYKDSSKLNNADLITKTLAEAADYIKELDLVSTDNLQRDLTRLGEIIDDKTEKIKRFKELNKTFGTDDGKTAHWLDQEAKAIKEFADSTTFAIEAADTLRKAWGDVSVGGEDHLKIRARSEALSDYGKTIQENIRYIKQYYYELETLDEIYEQATDQEKLVIDDYKAWEKSKDELIKYNKAIEDYIVTIRDANGQISDKFLTDGKFDVDKFIADFDKMGASSAVLSKQFNANKIALQEWLKAEKEVRKAAVENAKYALEQAKADEKAAKSQEELREATERVAKAQEELADARKKLDNFSIDATKEVKELNELAEKLRKLGMAAEDLNKADVSKFDKSLASLMDSLDAFGDGDIPSTFSDFKEDFMAMFESLDSFDLGGVADGLKDVFSGIFAGLPAEAKAAIALIGGVVAALDKLYEAGKRDFFEGLSKAGEALGKVADITRNIGQEIGDAFSSITGMDLDFSSLIQIPIDFESQMAKTAAIAGATGEAFEELEAKARELGSTTRYSATEVAEAMEYMGMAGWNNTEILAGLESVLNLATVSGMDLGKASDFVTDGLTALGMEAKDASYMVDLLAAASTSSNTTVDQMQRAFTNCAPVAGTLGITMKDLSIALGLMADKGVKGAKAGTALKNLMANMSAPTEKQLAYMKEFNLEGAQQDIVNGRLVDGLKKFKSALADLSPQQQNAIITTIAGKEALSGISALLNTTEADLADLEKAMNECGGSAEEMAKNFDNTVKGSLLGLASAMQETLLQVFDKVKDGIKDVTGQLTEFFNIINGFSQEGNGSGLEDAFTYLEKVSQGWGEALTKGIESAFKTLDEFVNTKGGIFDNVIQVGTNIINGICDGILEAEENGSLSNTIDGLIKKISNWIIENGPKIEKVGIVILEALQEGIENNEGLIGDAMDVICDIIASWTDSSGKLEATAGKFAEQFVALSIKNMFSKAKNWIREKGSALSELLTGPFTGGGFVGMIANVVTNLMDNLLGVDPIGDAKRWIKDKFGNWHPIQAIKDYFAEKKAEKGKDGTIKPKDIIKLPSIKECIDHIKNWFNGLSIVKTIKEALSKNNKDTSDNKIKPESIIKIPSIKEIKTFISDKLSGFNLLETMKNLLLGASKKTAGGKAASAFIKMADIFGDWNPVQDAKNWLDEKIGDWSITKWIKDKFSGKSTDKKSNNKKSNDKNKSTETEEINIDTLVNIDTKELKAVEESLKTLQTTAQTAAGVIRENFLSMANVARNQMLNISNIIRNQAINWANIIRNQILNARNGFTQQMLSMAAVARTQMVNVSNIIRNQSLSWANIISNQAKRARDNFTRQMMSMVKVARNQLYNVLTTVSSYMSKIANATNKSFNVKVNKSITSSNTGGGGSLPIMPAMASALHAANAASTLSIGNMGALAHSNSYGMSTGGGGSSFDGSSSGSMTIEIPVMLDGRELARASAKYVDNELKLMSKRENRKRGAK